MFTVCVTIVRYIHLQNASLSTMQSLGTPPLHKQSIFPQLVVLTTACSWTIAHLIVASILVITRGQSVHAKLINSPFIYVHVNQMH